MSWLEDALICLFLIHIYAMGEVSQSFISQDLLDYSGISSPRSGFCLDNHVFLNFKHQIVKLDLDGNLIAKFEQRGEGPGELRSGGPVFPFQGDVYCYDLLGNKVLVFGKDLNYIREIRLGGHSSGGFVYDFAPGKNYIYRLDINHVDGGELSISALDSTAFKNSKTFKIQNWRPLSSKSNRYMSFIYAFDNTFVVQEDFQLGEKLRIYLWRMGSNRLEPLVFPTPFETDKSLSINEEPGLLMVKGGVALVLGVEVFDDNLHVFVNHHLRRSSRGENGSLYDETIYEILINRNSFKQEAPPRIVPYRWLIAPFDDGCFLKYFPDKGLEIYY